MWKIWVSSLFLCFTLLKFNPCFVFVVFLLLIQHKKLFSPKIIFAVRTSTYVVSKNKHILMLYLMYIKLSNWDYIRCLVVMFQCFVNWPSATHSYFSSIYVRFSLALVEFTLFNKSEMDLHWLWSNLLCLTSQR